MLRESVEMYSQLSTFELLRNGRIETKLPLWIILPLKRFQLLLPPALVPIPRLRPLITIRIVYIGV